MTETSRIRGALASLAELRGQRALLDRKGVAAAFLIVSLALIVAQQASLLRLEQDPDPFYRNVLNLGASYQRYFSFFYYFGGFPVNLEGQKTSTLEETKATLTALGGQLRPDSSIYNRGSIVLFYPDAYLRGRPDTAEMRTGLALWFTIGLLALCTAFWYAGMPLLGLIVALLCGSDPFQVFELYHRASSTIFPTVIATGLFVVAVCVVLSSERGVRRPALSILLVAVTGAVCALQYEIRLEGVGVIAGAVFALLVGVPLSAARKLALAAGFVAAALLTTTLVNVYFRGSLAKANAVVAGYGGKATDLGDPYYSTQWWALWSGLGDFDEKYGFLADDRAGISYYYGQNTTRPSEEVHRANVLATVARDPGWFAGILAGRLDRVVLHNTPYRLSYGRSFYDIPAPPLLITLCGAALLLAGGWSARRLLLRNLAMFFVLPLSVGLVAVGQLADYGLQFYSVAHLFVFAFVVCGAIEALLLVTARNHA